MHTMTSCMSGSSPGRKAESRASLLPSTSVVSAGQISCTDGAGSLKSSCAYGATEGAANAMHAVRVPPQALDTLLLCKCHARGPTMPVSAANILLEPA